MDNKFECCYELPHKGIYLKIDKNETHVDIAMYVGHKHVSSVCINDDSELDKLINLLRSYKKRD